MDFWEKKYRLNQQQAPLYEACLEFVKRKQAPFYCPGHKGGRTLSPQFKSMMAELDLNNLDDTDTLHSPTKSIREAEALIADAYGVDKSFVLVGGSTLGDSTAAMIGAAPGQKILVQRNSHKSVIAGIILSGATPIWLNSDWDEDFGLFHGLSVKNLDAAIQAHPDSSAAFLLNPTYYGTAPDIAALVELCHKHKKLALVDEAHGSHFHFHPELPTAAEDAGADMIVQSFHKTLSALSQGAILHMRTDRLEENKVRKVLQLLQTTSPSFTIMSSLDLARRQMALEGTERLTDLLVLVRNARERIRSIRGARVLDAPSDPTPGSGFFSLDETKLLIDVSGWGLSGYEAIRILNKEFGIQPEVAGPSYILGIMSIGNNQEDVDRLVEACEHLSSQNKSGNASAKTQAREMADLGRHLTQSPTIRLVPRDAFFAPSQSVAIADCVGHICAEVVTPYPPGIPLLMPGEEITRESVEYLLSVKRMGNHISSTDQSLNTILVCKNN